MVVTTQQLVGHSNVVFTFRACKRKHVCNIYTNLLSQYQGKVWRYQRANQNP